MYTRMIDKRESAITVVSYKLSIDSNFVEPTTGALWGN